MKHAKIHLKQKQTLICQHIQNKNEHHFPLRHYPSFRTFEMKSKIHLVWKTFMCENLHTPDKPIEEENRRQTDKQKQNILNRHVIVLRCILLKALAKLQRQDIFINQPPDSTRWLSPVAILSNLCRLPLAESREVSSPNLVGKFISACRHWGVPESRSKYSLCQGNSESFLFAYSHQMDFPAHFENVRKKNEASEKLCVWDMFALLPLHMDFGVSSVSVFMKERCLMHATTDALRWWGLRNTMHFLS